MKKNVLIMLCWGCLALLAGVWVGNTFFIRKGEASSGNSVSKGTFRAREYGKSFLSKDKSSSVFTERDFWRMVHRMKKEGGTFDFQAALEPFLKRKERECTQEVYWALSLLVTRWAEKNPVEALDYVERKANGVFKRYLINQILPVWAEKDLDGASQYYVQNRDKITGFPVLTDLVKNWMDRSPEEAWQWISTLSPNEQRKSLKPFLERLFVQHPEKVSFYVAKWDPRDFNLMTQAGAENFESIVKVCARIDWDFTHKWIARLPADDVLAARRLVAVSLLAESSPKGMEELKALSVKSQARAIKEAAFQVMERRPFLGVTSWIENVSASGIKMDNQDEVFWALAHKHPAQMKEWLMTLPAGTMKDRSVEAYIRATVVSGGKNREDFIKNNVQDPELKASLLSSMKVGEKG